MKQQRESVDPDRNLIRHAVATVAYRGAKTLRDAPADFADFRIKPESRSPVEIVAHMGDLFDWALSLAKGREFWRSSTPQPWDHEVARWYSSLRELDTYLAGAPAFACPLEKLLQGPIADALTHVGQLAMLRHLFGAPTSGENFFQAEIQVGRVGAQQATPRKEFP